MKLVNIFYLITIWLVINLTKCYAQQAQLTWLGVLPGGLNQSYAFDVSDDGSVVVGKAKIIGGKWRAVRWVNGVIQNLGTLGGNESEALAVSADGSVVVGKSLDSLGRSRAFRWENGVMTDIGTLLGELGHCNVYDVSADGLRLVGESLDSLGLWRAIVSSGGSVNDLGTLGGLQSYARAISGDGLTIVGGANVSAGYTHAFRNFGNVMGDLGTLGGNSSFAFGVSSDGSVVVGISKTTEGYDLAFRWKNNTMQNLGHFGGGWSRASSASADGGIVVGGSNTFAGYMRAFRWTEANGLENLTNTYANLLVDGSNLSDAYAISPNGCYIVGVGWNSSNPRSEAYLLSISTTEVNDNALLSPSEYKLFQNYPNPFNPSTRISWQSPVGSHQTLKVYDVLGNEVATLVDEYKPAGRYEVEFSIPHQSINSIASSVFFYQLRAGNLVKTKKFILLK